MLSYFGLISSYLSEKVASKKYAWLPHTPVPIWPRDMRLLRMVDPTLAYVLTSVSGVVPEPLNLVRKLEQLFEEAAGTAPLFPDKIVVGLGFTLDGTGAGNQIDVYTLHLVMGPREAALREFGNAEEEEKQQQEQMERRLNRRGSGDCSSGSSSSVIHDE